MQEQTELGQRVVRSSAILAKGFRPFFVLAALWAAAAVPLWLFVQTGHVDVGAYLLPTHWHAHEMIFGFAVAVVAGFLLTAASNWTKRETATGGLLLTLCLVWTGGRVGLLASGSLPGVVVAAANLSFLPILALVVGRVLVRAESLRNYGIVLVLIGLWVAQLVVHAGAVSSDILLQRRGVLVGLDLILVIIAVIGGRVIPLFTRNTTGASDIRSSVWLDRGAIASVLACAAADALLAHGVVLAVVTGAAAVLTLLRARRWGTRHVWREPLLWVLHVGYLFLPVGLALRAAAALTSSVQSSASLHALTVGCIGLLTLGMMARVSFGHTGRDLSAPPVVTTAFVLLVLSAVTRAVGPMMGAASSTSFVHLSATLWSLAFLLYLVRVGPLLFRARPDGRPG